LGIVHSTITSKRDKIPQLPTEHGLPDWSNSDLTELLQSV